MRSLPQPVYDGVQLLTPRQAKGLEFDHVIVVEPALVELRELYVALTRRTGRSSSCTHGRCGGSS